MGVADRVAEAEEENEGQYLTAHESSQLSFMARHWARSLHRLCQTRCVRNARGSMHCSYHEETRVGDCVIYESLRQTENGHEAKQSVLNSRIPYGE